VGTKVKVGRIADKIYEAMKAHNVTKKGILSKTKLSADVVSRIMSGQLDSVEECELKPVLDCLQLNIEDFIESKRISKEFGEILGIDNERTIGKNIGRFEKAATELGKLVDVKQQAYGDSISSCGYLLRVFMNKYKKVDPNSDTIYYVIPDALMDHIAMQVRIIDKQNRIFSNPEGDLMNESPYGDIAGYGLLGKELL
jgi:hypothetical protein